ncbi:MAG: hypothetical protein WC551_09380 [Patescibacteria group bacterium]
MNDPKDTIRKAREAASRFQVEKSAAEVAALKKKNVDLLREAMALERQVGVLARLQGASTIHPFRRAKAGRPSGVAVIVPATDWHVEERISREATNGKNDFDLEEADARIKRFYRKVVELIDWQNHLSPVRELWHPLLGDLMSGYIHEELMETNALSPTEACVFLQDALCSGIDFLLRETRLPIYIPTCVGNHGRTTAKKRIKTSIQNSYEWLLYKTLERQYERHKRVVFRVGRGYHNTQRIMGRLVRFHHGDGLRYQGGVGGITIPVNKAIAQWDKVQTVDFDIFGHWHQFALGYPKWVSCGSLMGYSEYSVEIKAEFQHPSQAFIVLDQRYGLTSAIPIFLTPPASEKNRQ